jgi:hypothetical protein
VPDVAAITSNLLSICLELSSRMAAHWVFSEVGGIEYFSEGHEVLDRGELVALAATRLNCSEPDAEQRLSQKEALIAPRLISIDQAFTRVNGKHILHRVYMAYISGVRRGMPKSHFVNLLVRAVKVQGLHADIKEIIETKILNR